MATSFRDLNWWIFNYLRLCGFPLGSTNAHLIRFSTLMTSLFCIRHYVRIVKYINTFITFTPSYNTIKFVVLLISNVYCHHYCYFNHHKLRSFANEITLHMSPTAKRNFMLHTPRKLLFAFIAYLAFQTISEVNFLMSCGSHGYLLLEMSPFGWQPKVMLWYYHFINVFIFIFCVTVVSGWYAYTMLIIRFHLEMIHCAICDAIANIADISILSQK